MVPTVTHKRLLVVAMVLVVAAGTAFAGSAVGVLQQVDGPDGEQDGEADLRLIHASPDAPPVDVYMNGERVLEDFEYGSVTDYLEIDAGTNHVVVIASERPGTVVFEGDVIVDAEGEYTFGVTGEVGPEGDQNLKPVALEENATEPDSGIGALRLTHLSPDAPAVTVTINGTDTVVFEDVDFTETSQYMTIPEGEYDLDIRTGGAAGEVVQTIEVDVEEEAAQSVFVHGYADPAPATGDDDEEVRGLEVITTEDPVGESVAIPDIDPQPLNEDANESEE